MLDSADPINYGQLLGSNTPVHMMTVVGDGGEVNLPDQVIPVTTALPLAGQLPLANVIGLSQVVSDTTGDPASGLVLFSEGAHASSLNPLPSAAVTTEMQLQVAAFVASAGMFIDITNEAVISTN